LRTTEAICLYISGYGGIFRRSAGTARATAEIRTPEFQSWVAPKSAIPIRKEITVAVAGHGDCQIAMAQRLGLAQCLGLAQRRARDGWRYSDLRPWASMFRRRGSSSSNPPPTLGGPRKRELMRAMPGFLGPKDCAGGSSGHDGADDASEWRWPDPARGRRQPVVAPAGLPPRRRAGRDRRGQEVPVWMPG